MDDAIVLSDSDEDECVVIEETTIVTKEHANQKTCETSFSIVDAVNSRQRSSAILPRSQLDDDMDELDQLIEAQKKSTSSVEIEDVNDIFCSTSSTSEVVVTKKRKLTEEDREQAKRSRELEKERKAAERDQKKSEAQRKREEKEKEKETRRIEREISAAVNSKCELYTFCHVGKTILETLPGLEAEIRLLYAERKIEKQFKIDPDLGTRIEWRRKCIELREDEDGRSERFEYMSTQDLFGVVVRGEVLKEVISAGILDDFILEQRMGFQNGHCKMLIVSFGKLEVQKKKLHNLAIEIYEKHRAQILQLQTLEELALFTAQYLRSLSRREKKKLEGVNCDGNSGGGHRIQYQGEKGITIGSRNEIVADWWSKMLSTIDRLSDGQRRAVLKLIPDPIKAIQKYSKMEYSEAVKEVGELVAENGRKVGPAMAHRIITMLTDETGNALVD